MHHFTRAFCVFVVLGSLAANARGEENIDEGLRMFLGTWKVTGTAAGEELDGTFVAELGSSKSCIVSNYEFTLGGNPLKGNHIFGYDAATNTYRVLGFFSHGTVEDYYYKKESDDLYKGKYAGSSDGKTFEGDLTIRVVSDKVIRFEAKEIRRADERRPDLSGTFTRVED